ncbi:MAG TPA: alpha/beta fold hydrolase [Ramlibacter sp.]|nr:alpha/beta fold hydrolase [Ramlibacter sp.]
MAKAPIRPARLVADVRAGTRLIVDGVRGVTGIVEAMHQRIARVPPPLGQLDDAPTRGITGLVYRSIHGTTGLVGKALDAALAAVQALLDASLKDLAEEQATPRRDAAVAALNGLVGDHLERTGNPLAIAMQLVSRRPHGAVDTPQGPHVLLLIHGLCMSEHQWTRNGHDHGLALAEALGCTPMYARYNSGRHISASGRDLAAALEQMLATWPVPLESLTLIGHSMGGLVARSAVHQATLAGMAWPTRLTKLVFLGSPHHGAPLERGGNWLHQGLGISPYVAPFTRLSGLRSEGITDLRHGNLLEADWAEGRFSHRDTRQFVPLPTGVACYAVAATLGHGKTDEWLGDGLVPLASALGRHEKTTRHLRLPPSRTWIARGVNHLDLLSDVGVYHRLRGWLA